MPKRAHHPYRGHLADPDLWTAATLRNGLRVLAGATTEPWLAAAALLAVDLLAVDDDESVREAASMLCLDGLWPYGGGTDA